MINDAISDQSTFRLSCNEALIHRITPTNTISICADTDLPSLLNDLRLKQIDLIISPTTIHDPSFISESVFEEPMVVICRQDPHVSREKSNKNGFILKSTVDLSETKTSQLATPKFTSQGCKSVMWK